MKVGIRRFFHSSPPGGPILCWGQLILAQISDIFEFHLWRHMMTSHNQIVLPPTMAYYIHTAWHVAYRRQIWEANLSTSLGEDILTSKVRNRLSYWIRIFSTAECYFDFIFLPLRALFIANMNLQVLLKKVKPKRIRDLRYLPKFWEYISDVARLFLMRKLHWSAKTLLGVWKFWKFAVKERLFFPFTNM